MLNVLKMNRKAFTRKEYLIPADKNKTLTQIEPSMPKQWGGGALQRAAAPLFTHVPLDFSQRLIFIRGNKVFLSSEGFEIHFQSI